MGEWGRGSGEGQGLQCPGVPVNPQKSPGDPSLCACLHSNTTCPCEHQTMGTVFLLLIGGSQVGNLGLKEEEALFPKTSQRLGSCEYLYLFPELPLVTISLHF